MKRKQIYQVGLHDNFDHIETYVVAASSPEEAEKVAKAAHIDIYTIDNYKDMGIIIDSCSCITTVFDLDTHYNIYLVEIPFPAIMPLGPPDYEALSYAELQVLCKRKRVKAHGKREALINNLKWADEHLNPITDPTFGDITELRTIGELAHIFPDQEQTPISKLLEVIEQGVPLEKHKPKL